MPWHKATIDGALKPRD